MVTLCLFYITLMICKYLFSNDTIEVHVDFRTPSMGSGHRLVAHSSVCRVMARLPRHQDLGFDVGSGARRASWWPESSENSTDETHTRNEKDE